MATQITDHAVRAVARLLAQLRNKPNVESWVEIFADQVQALETVFFEISTARILANASGIQLDRIGAIVGEDRNGLDDDAYKIRINARIAINRASGTADEILNVFNVIWPGAYVLQEYQPAAFTLDCATAVTEPAAMSAVLQAMKAAGVRTFFIYTTDADMFAYDDASEGYDDGAYGGALE